MYCSPSVSEKNSALLTSPCIILETLTIEKFLANLGLENLKEKFDNQDITMDVLMEMDREGLREIGIASFGHQHEILEAVKQLG